MTTVKQAEDIILATAKSFGAEFVPFDAALGRVLAESIMADRDLPPCNRSTMDGIAVRYSAFLSGRRTFKINGVIAAGEQPIEVAKEDECVEIMTGAAVPGGADTVIRYEDTEISDGQSRVVAEAIKEKQNIHHKGKDRKKGELVAAAGQYVDATLVSMAASVGKTHLQVYRLPKVAVISTGDELVDVDRQPTDYQVRSSNSYTIKATLQQYCLYPDLHHIPDDKAVTKERISQCLDDYDVLLLSGGISAGKFDYVPVALEELGVMKLFHKVEQRPGKPFWFGATKGGTLVFAFPGNPVSTFMCLHRYFVPWLEHSLRVSNSRYAPPVFAALGEDIVFNAPLQYFAQVKIGVSELGQTFHRPSRRGQMAPVILPICWIRTLLWSCRRKKVFLKKGKHTGYGPLKG